MRRGERREVSNNDDALDGISGKSRNRDFGEMRKKRTTRETGANQSVDIFNMRSELTGLTGDRSNADERREGFGWPNESDSQKGEMQKPSATAECCRFGLVCCVCVWEPSDRRSKWTGNKRTSVLLPMCGG